MEKTIKTNLSLLPVLYQITKPVKSEFRKRDTPVGKSLKIDKYNSNLTYFIEPSKPISKTFLDDDFF